MASRIVTHGSAFRATLYPHWDILTDMDIENTMRFILDMEAKHEAWLQKHDEAMKQHDEAIRQHNEAIGQHDQTLARINAALETNTARIGQLVDVSLSLAHATEETHASIKELREAQSATDYKLNALIDTVDKLARNGHQRE